MNQQGWIRRVVALAWILFSSMAPAFAAELPDLAKLKLAAEGGDAYAQFQLAGEFDSKMDYTQAEAWLRKSASSGFAPAQGELGARLLRKYRSSFGQAGQTKAAAGREAITWLAAGAAQGDIQAQGHLASAIWEGTLIKQDLVAVYKWGSLAAKGSPLNSGAIAGTTVRNAAILKMTSEQIKTGEKLVAEFKPKAAEPPKPTGSPAQAAESQSTNEAAAKPEPIGLPFDLNKQESYFSHVYGKAKSESHLKSYAFMLPNAPSQMQFERPFILREYTDEKLRVKVLFSEATGQALWVHYDAYTQWTPEGLDAALKAYGSDWKTVQRNVSAAFLLADRTQGVYQSSDGIVAYKTILNDLSMYAPQVFADLAKQAEAAEQKRKAVPKF